jgi:site-specific DNA recombinase
MLAIYTRLSKEDEESNSIKNQIHEGELFAKSKGFSNYKIFNEGEGFSGGLEISERPELKKLVDEIVSGNISAVWFRNQNRLERDSFTFHSFVKVIKKANIEVYFGDKLNDYNDSNTFLQSSIISALNQYNKDLQGQQTKKVLRQRAKDGKAHGIMPYGYSKDENGYIKIDEEESEIVKRIYEMSLKGIGTNKIAELLNTDKIPTRYNNKYNGTYKVKDKFNGKYKIKEKKNVTWKGGTVRNILTNTIYKGKRFFSGELYDVPNIVSPTYWQKVNDNLKKNRNNSGKSVKHKYLLRGKLICGKCFSNYYGRSRVSKKDHYYMCSSKRNKTTNCGSRSINIDVIEDFIWQRFFADKELKNKVIEYFAGINANDELKDKEDNIKLFEKDLIKCVETRRKVVKKVVADIITDADGKFELDSLKKKQDTLESIIHNLKEEIESLKNIKENSDKYISELDKVKKATKFSQKKELIQKHIEKIEIWFYDKSLKAFDLNKGFYNICVYFKFSKIDAEEFIIPKSYNYALNINNKMVIPLSTLFKSFNKHNYKDLADTVFKQIGWNTSKKTISRLPLN